MGVVVITEVSKNMWARYCIGRGTASVSILVCFWRLNLHSLAYEQPAFSLVCEAD